MASRSEHRDSIAPESVEEALDQLDVTIDRLKVLYEQYFLGLQKQAPSYLHTDCERKLRDLMQLQLRNTGLRFRLATIQQKFGAYNTYWRRTLRQIENGTYIRNLSKIGRDAIRTGAAIPEEILRAMPKRMRDQVERDRAAAIAIAARHGGVMKAEDEEELLTLLPEGAPPPELDADQIAMIHEPSILKRELKDVKGPHVVADEEVDLDSLLAEANAAIDPPTDREIVIAKAPTEPPAPAPLRAARISGQFPVVKPTSPSLKAPSGTQPGVKRPTPPSTPTPPPRAPTPPPPTATPSQPIAKVTPPKPNVPVVPPRSNVAPAAKAPSQAVKPNPIAPGSAAARAPVDAAPLAGPFPRAQSAPTPPPRAPTPAPTPPPRAPTPAPTPPPRTPTPSPVARAAQRPPGMSDDDVNTLYSTYVKAKQLVGEQVGPNGYDKLLKTINAQAPKIMEQYKAKAVTFSVVVKDNQVVIKAKPKT